MIVSGRALATMRVRRRSAAAAVVVVAVVAAGTVGGVDCGGRTLL